MYCQSCGAENTEGARFCNMCGTSLAKAGETGGPLPSAAAQMAEATVPDAPRSGQSAGQQNQPGRTIVGQSGQDSPAPSGPSVGYGADLGTSGPSMMGVSLAGIGVRSSKKAWSFILIGAVVLLGAGALASWLAMGGSGAGSAGHAEADDPFVIGSPLPAEGDVDSITGMAGVATSAGDPPSMRSGSTPSMDTTSGTTSGSAMSGSAMRTPMSQNTGGSNTGTSAMSASMTPTMTGSTAMTSEMTTSEMTTSEMTTSEMTTEMSGGTGTSMAIGTGGLEEPEERDIEMELYSARVRFLIQRYYAGRAQSCFDRATRNTPSVSGTVVISMTIGAEGNVTRARVARNTTGNDALGNCLSAQVSSWRLSAPPGGSLQMQIPFSR